jgi:DNA processing protein
LTEVRTSDSAKERAALVALLRVRPGGAQWPDLMADVVEAGSAIAVWEARVPPALIPDPQLSSALDEAEAAVQEWQAQGLRMITVLDRDYPARLRGIHQAPPVLFAEGTLIADDLAVSVVGSREASERGLHIATGVATSLVGEGLTVLSGLALGIDAAAHRAALAAGGRTVAMLGTGIRRAYPAEHRELQSQIGERGLVLSQFWPDAPPQKHTFPMRNATMSGYGLATVVVEASERSGARIQARVAVEHGRPVILTDLVLTRTEWAKALRGRPGVYEAGGTSEVLDIVRSLTDQVRAVEAGLRGLAPA